MKVLRGDPPDGHRLQQAGPLEGDEFAEAVRGHHVADLPVVHRGLHLAHVRRVGHLPDMLHGTGLVQREVRDAARSYRVQVTEGQLIAGHPQVTPGVHLDVVHVANGGDRVVLVVGDGNGKAVAGRRYTP